MTRKAVIYRGETYIRAKDLGIEPNNNIELQAILHAPKMRPAKEVTR